MDELLIKAITETAQDFAAAIYPENRMGWVACRKSFVKSFLDEVTNRYYDSRMKRAG